MDTGSNTLGVDAGREEVPESPPLRHGREPLHHARGPRRPHQGGRDVLVQDATSGADLTQATLTQIILESRGGATPPAGPAAAPAHPPRRRGARGVLRPLRLLGPRDVRAGAARRARADADQPARERAFCRDRMRWRASSSGRRTSGAAPRAARRRRRCRRSRRARSPTRTAARSPSRRRASRSLLLHRTCPRARRSRPRSRPRPRRSTARSRASSTTSRVFAWKSRP